MKAHPLQTSARTDAVLRRARGIQNELLRVAIIVVAVALPTSIRAQDQVSQKASLEAIDITNAARAALAAITETADRICNIVRDEGSATNLKASGEIKTQLDGLVSKIVKVDGTINADSAATRYQGVLQADLPKALSDNAGCKLQVFLKLSDQMVPQAKTKPDPPPSAPVVEARTMPSPVVAIAPAATSALPHSPPQSGVQIPPAEEARTTLPPVVAITSAVTGASPPPSLSSTPDWRDVRKGVAIENSQGRWTTGSREQCATRYYLWNVDGNRISFRDQSDQIDVEQIFAKLDDGFLTATVSSFHRPGGRTEAIGTKWQYQFLNNDIIHVHNLKTDNSFSLTRC